MDIRSFMVNQLLKNKKNQAEVDLSKNYDKKTEY